MELLQQTAHHNRRDPFRIYHQLPLIWLPNCSIWHVKATPQLSSNTSTLVSQRTLQIQQETPF